MRIVSKGTSISVRLPPMAANDLKKKISATPRPMKPESMKSSKAFVGTGVNPPMRITVAPNKIKPSVPLKILVHKDESFSE